MPASAIQWVKPREAWWLNRRFNQPGEGLPEFFAGVGLQFKAMAQATSVYDVFARLEADGFYLRVDTTVAPTISRGAMVSEAELALLRQIGDVVRRGQVRRIERDRIVFDGGSAPTNPDTLHVHCAAVGLARPALRPIFETDRVTVQPLFWSFACYPAAAGRDRSHHRRHGREEPRVPVDEVLGRATRLPVVLHRADGP